MMETEYMAGHDGSFSIRVGDKVSKPTYYSGIATLEVNGVLYVAVSGYYEGVLPTEQVLILCRPAEAPAVVLTEEVPRERPSATEAEAVGLQHDDMVLLLKKLVRDAQPHELLHAWCVLFGESKVLAALRDYRRQEGESVPAGFAN